MMIKNKKNRVFFVTMALFPALFWILGGNMSVNIIKNLNKILCLGVMLALASFFTNCRIDPKTASNAVPEIPWPTEPSQPVQNGLFHLIGKGGEYAVIYKDYMTLVWMHGEQDQYCDVVKFSRIDGAYNGENVRGKISFKLFDDVLTVSFSNTFAGPKTNKKMQFMRNTSVELLNEEPVQAPPPINVGCSPEYFRWNQYDLDGTAAHFPDSVGDVMRMGILGAGFEVKNAETDDFKSVSIANFTGGPYWHFSLLGPYYLKSTPGTYIARIKHLGGPFVKRGPWNPSYAETESEIYFSLDSKPVYLKITVDSNGKVTGEEINGYEQKLLGDL